MAGSLTDTGEKETLDWWGTKWDELGLSTADPGETGGTLAEPVGNGYARVALTGAEWAAAVGGDPSSMSNDSEISFAAASGGNWGTITHYALFEGTVLKATGELTVPLAINDGDQLKFAVGAIVITAD